MKHCKIMKATPTVVIAGAGSVGCFVGGMLARNGHDVHFLARERIASMLLTHGLRITDHEGLDETLPASSLKIATDPAILSEANIIIVTVKSGASAEMGELIATHAPKDVIVISLQNGVSNTGVLRLALPDRDVRAGMIAYNVLNAGEGRFHRGTGGGIVIESGEPDIAAMLGGESLPMHTSTNILAVQWGKLLVNLNNALNALSGVPLLEELTDRGWRKLFADQIAEALPALNAAGIKPRSAFPLPIKMVPSIMRLPTPVYKLIAARSLKIDPEARSSMWEDLESGRKTEVDELQGAVAALCAKHGLAAPVNTRVKSLINDAEAKGGGSPKLTPEDVRAELS